MPGIRKYKRLFTGERHIFYMWFLPLFLITPKYSGRHLYLGYTSAIQRFLVCREGYDARTGKWVNKKPSPYAYAITADTYQEVKNWYATDSGKNNPDHLPLQVPRPGYTYIYTPYKDSKHPNVVGMSVQGADGFKGYWYADDLTKATDSSDASGSDMPIAQTNKYPADLKYGGYDARTGKWIDTPGPTENAYAITQGTYKRVKNWYTTNFGVNNPLQLPLEAPTPGYTYIYVPYNDPKHPGVIGMSFQGDGVFRGYWYADKLGPAYDSAANNTPAQNAPAAQQNSVDSAQNNIRDVHN